MQAATYAANADRIRLDALRHALDALRQTRASFAANRTIPEAARRQAIVSIEESIRDLEQDRREPD